MSFLVILISLMINYLWLKDFDRFDDSWFFRFRSRVEALCGRIQALRLRWVAALLLIYGIPLAILIALLFMLSGRFFGLPVMALHILVLLIAFDRTQPGHLAKEFLQRWSAGDEEACALYLQKELDLADDEAPTDCESLSEFFSQQFVYLFFERMFVMFFWYMLTGPIGILAAYITYQLRDSHHEDQPEAQVSFVALLVSILEWLPVRLVALTFSLAGNFVRCFESLLESLWTFERNPQTASMLYGYARCALTGLVDAECEDGSCDDEGRSEGGADDLSARQQKAREISALVSLLERSQAIWLVALALITIFAI